VVSGARSAIGVRWPSAWMRISAAFAAAAIRLPSLCALNSERSEESRYLDPVRPNLILLSVCQLVRTIPEQKGVE